MKRAVSHAREASLHENRGRQQRNGHDPKRNRKAHEDEIIKVHVTIITRSAANVSNSAVRFRRIWAAVPIQQLPSKQCGMDTVRNLDLVLITSTVKRRAPASKAAHIAGHSR